MPPPHAAGARSLLAGVALLGFAPGAAADVSTRFLQALRAEGHNDLVLEFLDRAEDDPLVSAEFRARVPAERFATLFAQASAVRDPRARVTAIEGLLPDLRRVAGSDAVVARLLTDAVDRVATSEADASRAAAIRARRTPVGPPRDAALAASRDAISAARDRLSEAESLIAAEREPLQGVQPDSADGRRRADLGARLGVVRLLRSRLLHELAETHPDASAERKRLNAEAAAELGALYEKYSKWGVGLYAHLYEGRCYRLSGEDALAVAALEDLAAQPAPTPELRRIVTLAQAELAALRLDQGRAEDALAAPARWLAGLASDEAETAEGAELRYRLALAAIARAGELTGAPATRQLRQAREWLEASSRTPSEVQAAARARWADLAAQLGVAGKPPADFDEAFQTGGEAVQAMVALDLRLKDAPPDQRDTIAAQRAEVRAAAYRALTAAAKLADAKTDPERAATARYQVAWLDWEAGDTKQAAVRAEYVARRDGGTTAGGDAARLALSALERLAREGDTAAAKRLGEFADFIATERPDSDAAASAAAVQVATALRAGDFAAAAGAVDRAPESLRPELRLRLVVAEWERTKTDRGALVEGLDGALNAATAEGEASPLAVTAALYLAEAALDRGEIELADTLLDAPAYGPATRLAAGEPPTDAAPFAAATHKARLRASALAGRSTDAPLAGLAEAIAESDPDGTGKTWLAVAAAVAGDLDRAPSDRRESVAAALSVVLDRLTEASPPTDWNTSLWVAQNRLRCSDSAGEAGQRDLEAAATTLEALVARAEQEPAFAPSDSAKLAARLRLAQCRRRLGDHEAAIESLAAILTGRAALLEVQREAAETLQAWGAKDASRQRFEEAIAGARPGPDGKNLLWGWSKIASVAGRFAAGDPERTRLFFDAWRNVAQSRLEAARLSSGADRAEQLRKAASTILALQRQNPDLGGEDTRRGFDRLLRDIQSDAGESPTGLVDLGG